MHLDREFKRFVRGMKSENDIERHQHGQRPYKNLFRYYRHSRNYLKDKYNGEKNGNPE